MLQNLTVCSLKLGTVQIMQLQVPKLVIKRLRLMPLWFHSYAWELKAVGYDCNMPC